MGYNTKIFIDSFHNISTRNNITCSKIKLECPAILVDRTQIVMGHLLYGIFLCCRKKDHTVSTLKRISNLIRKIVNFYKIEYSKCLKRGSHIHLEINIEGVRLYGDGDFKSRLEKLGKNSKISALGGFK